MTKVFLILAVIIIGLLLGGCSGGTPQTGTLEGEVTIGPILPVEKEGGKREIPCEVYQARKVMVYDKNGRNLVKQVDIDCNGHYSVELRAGVYTVDINRIGIDNSRDVPKKIEIRSRESVEVNIDIDTGIR